MEPTQQRFADIGLEDAVLGTLLRFPDTYRPDLIQEGHFWQAGHRKVVRIMREKGPNPQALTGVYSIEQLIMMMESTLTSAHLEHDLGRLTEMARVREANSAAEDMIRSLDKDDMEGSLEAMTKAAGRLARAAGGGSSSTVYRMSQAREVLARFRESQSQIRTGLHSELSIRRKQLVYIGARPGCGKTAALGQIAATIGSEQPGSVLIYSMEMDAGELMHRLLCAHVGGWLDPRGDRYMQVVDAHAEWLAKRRIIIDDQASLTMSEIEGRTARIMASEEVSMVGVDYASLIQAGRGEKRNEAVADVSRRLKILSKTGNIPVVCLSQLKREDGKEPTLESLAESDGLGRDADQVWILWYEDKLQENEDQARMALSRVKCRGGRTGKLYMTFDKPAMQFLEERF